MQLQSLLAVMALSLGLASATAINTPSRRIRAPKGISIGLSQEEPLPTLQNRSEVRHARPPPQTETGVEKEKKKAAAMMKARHVKAFKGKKALRRRQAQESEDSESAESDFLDIEVDAIASVGKISVAEGEVDIEVDAAGAATVEVSASEDSASDEEERAGRRRRGHFRMARRDPDGTADAAITVRSLIPLLLIPKELLTPSVPRKNQSPPTKDAIHPQSPRRRRRNHQP